MYTPDAPLRGGLAVVGAKGPFRPLFHGGFAVGRRCVALGLSITDEVCVHRRRMGAPGPCLSA